MLRDEPLDLVLISSPMSRQGRRPRLAADQPMRAWAGALVDAEVRRLRRRGIQVISFQPDDAGPRRDGPQPDGPGSPVRHRRRRHRLTLAKLARADVASRLAALRL